MDADEDVSTLAAQIVTLFVVVATFRWLIEIVAAPTARQLGVRKQTDVDRFSLQYYYAVKGVVLCGWGIYELSSSSYSFDTSAPFFFNTSAMWHNYPPKMTSSFRTYYLVQLAFWSLELAHTIAGPRQHDFAMLLAHHVITIGLIVASYRYGFVRQGHALLAEQDIADGMFPFAKLCVYTSRGDGERLLRDRASTASNVLFAAFAAVWILTRHVVFGIWYWSILTEWRTEFIIEAGQPGGNKCVHNGHLIYSPDTGCHFDDTSYEHVTFTFQAALGVFQLLQLIWCKQLLVAVWKAISGADLDTIEAESSQALKDKGE